jgi:hypothetical protein
MRGNRRAGMRHRQNGVARHCVDASHPTGRPERERRAAEKPAPAAISARQRASREARPKQPPRKPTGIQCIRIDLFNSLYRSPPT